ncbi:MAG: S-formylglutathione hydrolase [Alphaproteobacteria bacterium]|nr:MAG: S-formylglutathione hydrolase [Alphaproteobacteria bacterium]
MSLELFVTSRCFGGEQRTYRHQSTATGTTMRFAVFVPPQALNGTKVPVVWFLSGLTCTEENFTAKAGAQRIAAQLGLMLIMPDTSPRGDGVPDDADKSYDFGLGAGFYVNATVAPWSTNYRMATYCGTELPALVAEHLPADISRQSIMGHSMGGHGALTLALNNPGQYQSVSAFAPICSPSTSAWGRKALTGYLGSDESAWRKADTCALIADGARLPDILVDQGTADQFLSDLQPEKLQAACSAAGIPLTLRMQQGYDHSYFFIATFIEDHLRYHARHLGL